MFTRKEYYIVCSNEFLSKKDSQNAHIWMPYTELLLSHGVVQMLYLLVWNTCVCNRNWNKWMSRKGRHPIFLKAQPCKWFLIRYNLCARKRHWWLNKSLVNHCTYCVSKRLPSTPATFPLPFLLLPVSHSSRAHTALISPFYDSLFPLPARHSSKWARDGGWNSARTLDKCSVA